MSHVRRAVRAIVLGAAAVVVAVPAWAQSGSEWKTYGGDDANTRYSTLNQINPRTSAS